MLGAVFLVVTGGEALYADMGHFGKAADPAGVVRAGAARAGPELSRSGGAAAAQSRLRAAVLPAGAAMDAVPLVCLATAAAIIASQALISASFSVTRQAIQLGLAPRLDIEHTSLT